MSSTTQQWVWTADVYNADSIVGTWSWFASSPQIDGGYFSNSSVAQNDCIQFNGFLQLDGNVTLKAVLFGIITNPAGISTIQTSPTGQNSWTDQATIDWYTLSGANNSVQTTSTWTMTAGVYDIRIIAKTKNASSSAYRLWLNQFSIIRTA